MTRKSRNQMLIQVGSPGHSVIYWERSVKLIMIPDTRSHVHQIAGCYQNLHAHVTRWLRGD